MTNRRKVLITGARGRIGNTLVEGLKNRYDLRLHNRTPETEPQGYEHATAVLANFDDVAPMMDGVDTVIHMAANPSVQAPWDDILNDNIIATRNILEAAKDAGVRRVIFASSNHSMGMYDRDGEWPVYVTMPVRPDSHYGASKVIGEVFGRYYYDAFGLEFISLRIGWFTDRASISRMKDHAILRAMWIGPKDMVNVTKGAIETATPFGIYYAISENPDRKWDITNTIIDLGYRPVERWDEYLDVGTSHEPGDPPLRADWP
ncbi:MAG TPA: NAD(P)-dependent oxidoreductase [Thermomicrobiales bacterium]|nr:NAD(P)-dependent oxidoreductase [Thermomicrobiales bacterium]